MKCKNKSALGLRQKCMRLHFRAWTLPDQLLWCNVICHQSSSSNVHSSLFNSECSFWQSAPSTFALYSCGCFNLITLKLPCPPFILPPPSLPQCSNWNGTPSNLINGGIFWLTWAHTYLAVSYTAGHNALPSVFYGNSRPSRDWIW